MKRIRLKDCSLTLAGVVKGLVREGMKVERMCEECNPDVIALSISREELEGLKNFNEELLEDVVLSDYEEIYAENLHRFGAIKIPPPCYDAALRVSKDMGTELVALDISESEFTTAFCAYVTGLQLLRHSLRKPFIRNRRFRARSAEEFVLEWDKRINNMKGFKQLEERRERHMARELINLATTRKNVLAIIELERFGGVVKRLKD